MGLCRGTPRTIKKWTGRENAVLRKRVGDLRREVAKDLERSTFSIQSRYGAMKLNSPRYLNSLRDARFAYEPWLPCEDAELRKRSSEHIADVAASLDRSIAAVRSRSYKLSIKRGWSLRQKAEQEVLAKRFAALRKKGLTSIQIGERFGVRPRKVMYLWNCSV